MIAVIRIKGQIGISKKAKETLHRIRLRKKYTCVVVDEKDKVKIGMIKSVENFVAYGEINEETLKKLKEKRGKKDSKEKLKAYFRLHPPRGGAKTKQRYPKGILGNNKKDINKLIERML